MSVLSRRRAEPARRIGAPLRVGHKGAAAHAEGNSAAAFRAALELGVDMIEFDVMREPGGALVLAHDPADAASREPLGLAEGLDLLAAPEFANVELDVDVKHPGFEPELAAALAERGLEGRTLVSSTFLVSLRRLGALLPGVPRGLSVPRARRDYLRSPFAPAALAYMGALRARLPGRAERLIRAGEIEAVMAHWLLVGPRLASAVHRSGGRLFVWTVDDARRAADLAELGVDGIIGNDPGILPGPRFALDRPPGADV